jgi:hypothetical protein
VVRGSRCGLPRDRTRNTRDWFWGFSRSRSFRELKIWGRWLRDRRVCSLVANPGSLPTNINETTYNSSPMYLLDPLDTCFSTYCIDF